MRRHTFKTCYLIEISGKTASILEESIDTFFYDTVVPLLVSLANSDEEIVVHIGHIDCTDLEGQPHTCIARIKMENVDIPAKKQ